MPGPQDLIRTAVGLPWAAARRLIGLGRGLLPGASDDAPSAGREREERVAEGVDEGTPDIAASEAAAAAMERSRDPVEESAPEGDEPSGGHVDSEFELVAESADAAATEPPGPQLHVDEPWANYKRMKVAEIVQRLEGQPTEVLAAVELYESTHRRRQGVLEAVKAANRG